MDIFSTGYTSTMLTANVATAVQTTFASIAPILEVVVGIILAFIVAKYVISLFKHTGRASK
jgi:type II secretory pathway component PulF